MKEIEEKKLKELLEKDRMSVQEPNNQYRLINKTERFGFSKNKILLKINNKPVRPPIEKLNKSLEGLKNKSIANSSELLNSTVERPVSPISTGNIGYLLRGFAPAYKNHMNNQLIIINKNKKLASLCSRECRRDFSKTSKTNPSLKSKRINKELITFVKKVYRGEINERSNLDKNETNLSIRRSKEGRINEDGSLNENVRLKGSNGNTSNALSKRAEAKLRLQEKKRLEEIEELNRQKRKFNYLLSQTEAFANYFLHRKTSNPDLEGIKAAKKQLETQQVFSLKKKDSINKKAKFSINGNELKAKNVIMESSLKSDTASIVESNLLKTDSILILKTDSNLTVEEEVEAYVHQEVLKPKIINATLRDYQLKGLNWLVSLYNQGINGILADDMGLGKTIQAIALMAYLYETLDIKGPFLIISPASTLHNWIEEIERFAPIFKCVKYWGSINERKDMRKSIRHSNVIVTSYQLAIADDGFLKKVKFQYMILDEAQAIKSNTSIRWKSLLSFKAKNKLLLTGTPIQNNMTELWTLLHFIMPTLFDSLNEFSDWFSKEIENNSIDQAQIERLHSILKPFMLRRHKDDIKDEIGEKFIKLVYCDFSLRQKILYEEIIGSKINYENIVMQLKKVCNHPDLFEKLEPCCSLDFNIEGRSSILGIREKKFKIIPQKIKFSTFDSSGNETTNQFNSGILLNPIKLNSQKDVLLKAFNFDLKKEPLEFFQRLESQRKFNENLINRFLFIKDKIYTNELLTILPIENQDEVLNIKDQNLQNEITNVKINEYVNKNTFIPPKNTFIKNSGKLLKLEEMLPKLKKEDHRVLIYFQMTKMMDLFEEFLAVKEYSYLRLDGSSKISQRKDLVNKWQNDDSVFIFILSTRAGGVGINLTAADTVIFYDSDWNPTVDQQAMDRVHRLGQTKDVTIYKLISRNSIEERIMKMAKKKDDIQKIVIQGDVFKI